jgi:glycosyltransferase involved in cell wall biosynthesis
MFNPLVSIIIPVYNGADYLGQAIESALKQTYQKTEILVINDGSIDQGETEKVALSYGNKIRYYYKTNGGAASALNFGISRMKGEYLSWLSHDDKYLEYKIEKQISFIEQNALQNSIVYSNFELIDKDSKHISTIKLKSIKPENFRVYITQENSLNGCTFLIPYECLKETGSFNESLNTTQDYDMWFRMADKCRFIHQNEVLFQSRTHDNQGTKTMKQIAYQECNELIIRFTNQINNHEFAGLSGYDRSIKNWKIADSCCKRNFEIALNHIIQLNNNELHSSSLIIKTLLLLIKYFKIWIKYPLSGFYAKAFH